uniref:phosphoribosyl-dephospho-CoA transferase MdcG domain-containing protein n=1 Tax=Pseudomonas sp. 43(2021) TaxID=2813560 RepID=UPI001FAF8BD9
VVNLPLAHDLLWGMTPAQLPADAPAWAIAALAAGQPVVVRRALSEEGLVAVGVRGVLREQRLATFMPLDSIACRVSPEALCQVECERDLPVMQALKQLRPILDDCGWVWGVSGINVASRCSRNTPRTPTATKPSSLKARRTTTGCP